jgi:hypothetical protein
MHRIAPSLDLQAKPAAQLPSDPQGVAQNRSPLLSEWQTPPVPHCRSLVHGPQLERVTGM